MTGNLPQPGRRRYRSLFVSDLHLGARGSRAGAFLEFLRDSEAGTIYLVGDIFDIWHNGRLHWGAEHDEIVEELTRRARTGVRVVYLPGNHDDALRRHDSDRFGEFELRESVVHVAADGQRYLVLHGDQCDARYLRWHVMTRIGSRANAMLRAADQWLKRHLHRSAERGLFELAIAGVNALMLVGNRFEERLTAMALENGARGGVICGHYHKAALHHRNGLIYANCGDWVDNQTALVETESGALRVLEWSGETCRAEVWSPALSFRQRLQSRT
ncbi:UDP-2,3-diacylglucosamine diphosphatase [Paenirhodobacter enshiensis]|uniref:UDP-2,3-diacylglucosamine diphosphatase n=1 Tax=Paenirhodobacter enshiensis TaxID=1105367 RepID=UPI0035ADF462